MEPPTAIPVVSFQSLGDRPVRRAVRRLRWFKSSFASQVESVAADTGIAFSVDNQSLTRCFLQWLQMFEAQKPDKQADRHAYVGFAAGLMLEQLVAFKPLTVNALPPDADMDNPAFFWPEGYVYTVYCLNVRSAVLKQEFDEETALAPEFSEIRAWWSFRENVADDQSMTIPFLDLFAGNDPDWVMPRIFRNRDATAIASRFRSSTAAIPGKGGNAPGADGDEGEAGR